MCLTRRGRVGIAPLRILSYSDSKRRGDHWSPAFFAPPFFSFSSLRKKRTAAASEEACSIPFPPGRRKLHIRSLLLPSQIVTVSLGHNLAIWNFTTPHAILMMADRQHFSDTVCRGRKQEKGRTLSRPALLLFLLFLLRDLPVQPRKSVGQASKLIHQPGLDRLRPVDDRADVGRDFVRRHHIVEEPLL